MKPESLMETAITTQKVQPVRSWGDSIRYCIPTFLLQAKLACPMIEGSSTGFSTIYTVINKQAQKISATLRQHDPVITFESKATQSFRRSSRALFIRHGEFHIALNFPSLLGRKFHSSGLGDLLIGYGV